MLNLLRYWAVVVIYCIPNDLRCTSIAFHYILYHLFQDTAITLSCHILVNFLLLIIKIIALIINGKEDGTLSYRKLHNFYDYSVYISLLELYIVAEELTL